MAATREDVDGWIKYAKKNGYKFIVSVCDTYDWDDYPVYCKDEERLTDEYNHHNGSNMQKINEVIRIDGDVVTENLRLSSALAFTVTKKESTDKLKKAKKKKK